MVYGRVNKPFPLVQCTLLVLPNGVFSDAPVKCRPGGSVADPERFDGDPDPTFHADTDPNPDPDPNCFSQRKKKQFRQKLKLIFQKLAMGNFLSNNDLIDKKHRYQWGGEVVGQVQIWIRQNDADSLDPDPQDRPVDPWNARLYTELQKQTKVDSQCTFFNYSVEYKHAAYLPNPTVI